MENFLKDKKINVSIFLLLIIVSLFVIIKTVNEIKLNRYIGNDSQISNTITVTGKGEELAVSNIANLTINIEKEAPTSKEAQDLLNQEITKTLNYLKEQKIEEKDIKSEFGGVSPKYSYEAVVCYSYPCPSKDPKITGYMANQSISIKIREVDNVNNIRTGLTGIGLTNINGPVFSIDDQEQYKEKARAKAIADAKEKAEVLAKDLGVRLDDIVSFSEDNNGMYPMYESKAMMGAGMVEDQSAPVLPKGENKITSNVTITYEIR